MPTLQFKGKNIIWNHHLSVPYHTLEEIAKLHFQPDKSNGNIIIEGDNLLALKALLPMYAGKVKVVCIDPPYNTGNEGWVYNDSVNSPLIKDWLGKEVGKDDLTRHDKWLCMMTPRLRLLRELLADDGVICINIDDIEVARLISLMDEIFGEGNKEEIICWRRRHNQPNDKSKAISKVAEFIVVYAKNMEYMKSKKAFHGLPLTGDFSNPDNDPISEKKFFVGTLGKQAIYPIYKQDYDALTKMALNLELAEKIIADQPDKKRIVYAPACFLDEEYMEEKQIEFVSIPYNMFQRKT